MEGDSSSLLLLLLLLPIPLLLLLLLRPLLRSSSRQRQQSRRWRRREGCGDQSPLLEEGLGRRRRPALLPRVREQRRRRPARHPPRGLSLHLWTPCGRRSREEGESERSSTLYKYRWEFSSLSRESCKKKLEMFIFFLSPFSSTLPFLALSFAYAPRRRAAESSSVEQQQQR